MVAPCWLGCCCWAAAAAFVVMERGFEGPAVVEVGFEGFEGEETWEV